MNRRKQLKFSALAGLLVLFTIIGLVIYPTIVGTFILRVSRWDEDSFKGKSLTELERSLREQGIGLHPVDYRSVATFTDADLGPNQKIMRFLKGKEYRWFGIGTAVNMGYAVVEKRPHGEIVVDILRARSIDSF
jgi:hypothetical protein